MSSYIGNQPTITNVTGYLGAFRNRVINGGMDFDQRNAGTLVANVGAGVYTLDRWFANRVTASAGGQVQQIAGLVNGNFQNMLKVSRLAGNAALDAINLWYSGETADSIPLIGQPLTLSFWAKAGANLSGPVTWSIITGTGTDQRVSSGYTGSVTLATGTLALTTTLSQFVFNTAAFTGSEFGLKFSHSAPTGTAGADDSFSITGVQLETGTILSPVFERRMSAEFLLALRYYQVFQEFYAFASYVNGGTTTVNNSISYPWMRSIPTVGLTGLAAVNSTGVGVQNIWNNVASFFTTSVAAGQSSLKIKATLDAEL